MRSERTRRDDAPPDRTVVRGRPPSRLWKVMRPFVLALAALLATLGIPIIVPDPARRGTRTAEVAPREDDPERVA